jgi:hypothetical protein
MIRDRTLVSPPAIVLDVVTLETLVFRGMGFLPRHIPLGTVTFPADLLDIEGGVLPVVGYARRLVPGESEQETHDSDDKDEKNNDVFH